MTLLQTYVWKQAFWPLLLTLAALTTLAVLTQSLSTLDLIVENRQSALTFLRITLLALPQLIAIILPLSVFIAVLYTLNRLNVDSELIVAKSVGTNPWQLSNPIIRVACWAMIVHLLINLLLQPLSFRQMRQEILTIRTDIASQMVRAGEFITPVPGLTFYARELRPNGGMKDVIIRDARTESNPITYIAETGYMARVDEKARLALEDGIIQQVEEGNVIRPISFEKYQLDLVEIFALDTTLRLKPSDRFLHELFYPSATTFLSPKQNRILASEGHARLSAPLYNVALALLALSFLIRGRLRRMGYGRQIAICAVLGFGIRLSGFVVASAAEGDRSLNAVQYAIPLSVIAICLWYLLNKNRAGWLWTMLRRAPVVGKSKPRYIREHA